MKRSPVLLLLLLFLQACQTGRIDVYTCPDPCRECEDPCSPCRDGECVPLPPLGWDGPVLLWSGSPGKLPDCPERAPNPVYEGHAGLQSSPQCPSCSCGPAACELPDVVASGSSMCQAGAPEVSFPTPDSWTGACTSPDPILDTDVDSVRFLAPELAPCAPIEGPIVEGGSFDWSTLARACQALVAPDACDATSICVPSAEPPPPDFSQCIFLRGEDIQCPLGWPNRQVFYGDIDTSGASCTPCACSSPQGGACHANMIGYSDPGCTGAVVTLGNSTLSSSGCSAAEPGYPLASMEATWVENVPGACDPSGGEPVGEARPAQPATFCCRTE